MSMVDTVYVMSGGEFFQAAFNGVATLIGTSTWDSLFHIVGFFSAMALFFVYIRGHDPKEVLKFIDGSYRENITLDHMAQIAHMSKYHFCRTFRSVTGTTPLNYVNTVRLTRVHNLLLNTTESIDEIARNTGFSSYVNLARVFKKVYGVSPRTFRKYGGETNGRQEP